MRLRSTLKAALAAGLATACAAATAQLLPQAQLPDIGGTVDRLGRVAAGTIDGTTRGIAQLSPRELARLRLDRLRALVRSNPELLEMTDSGPAVRGQVIAIDPDPATLEAIEAAGFTIAGEEWFEGLDLRTVTLEPPRGWSIDRALSRLRRAAPNGQFEANHIHTRSGPAPLLAAGTAVLAQGGTAGARAIGLIDGGVAEHPSLSGPIEQRGFAAGAPRPSAHGTAVASLAVGTGGVRGAAPGAPLVVADVYGRDPAGGNAVAVARALGFMVQRRVAVVAVSLVGPANALVARAIAQARARGTHVVAAVGNDGPAAPPAYPASYPGVIAVTGVDRRNRVLIEAGRALHLDYAAPGADMAAAAGDGRLAAVRGTSYAVPLVAGRLFRHADSPRAIALLDAEAAPPRRRGYGRGLICGDCRTPPPRG